MKWNLHLQALTRLGLITWIGLQTEKLILSVNEDSRLTVAILLILCVSAVASSFIDNVPLTTMMTRIAVNLADDEGLNLPLQPLVWALAFGACLGGNVNIAWRSVMNSWNSWKIISLRKTKNHIPCFYQNIDLLLETIFSTDEPSSSVVTLYLV